MFDIEDKNYCPVIKELTEYVDFSLFNELISYMESEYKAQVKIEYSGDKVLLGWNVKFKKAGRTLCTVYPRKGYYHMLLIVGSKEKQRTEQLLPTLSSEFQKIYNDTKEGMGQRWMLFDFAARTDLYDDVLKIIRIRRESNLKSVTEKK
ncbi:MAG: DUF3788 domain-containing protein [Oscillospiraceae bacterium]|nr:DUF3788 domain-containing protein [Oscillospiraceae bacterium]